ncbi:hypothetical protein BCL76_101799 [Streptomyces sp. CG 926]|uniref:hypothetical protein n=1 Tax=Streptomyces sp. CG 926 TaxID=1882405 RepID=UPI000D6C9847|nr:hypothetical protein [Streptomyces sp. CG 926]PWK75064.1 hypothetical protein BCL76_101799 [Streptomyces sp. CG 926]
MTISLGERLTLAPARQTAIEPAETCSGLISSGTATDRALSVDGRPELTVRDIRWRNGERDVRMHLPDVLPEMPRALAKLHDRRRAGVYRTDDGRTWMTAWSVLPGDGDWPKWRRPTGVGELGALCGADRLRVVHDHGVVEIGSKEALLGDPGRTRRQLCALLDDDVEAAPAVLYAVTRLVPVLRHIGWL